MSNYCEKCNDFVDSKIILQNEEFKIKGERIEIISKVKICLNCGEELWDDELETKNLTEAYNIYRKSHNLLLPQEIKDIRSKYGISQVTFSKVLGLGEKTIARYENGSLQDNAQNNLILLQKNPSNFKLLWENNKSNLTESENEKIANYFFGWKNITFINIKKEPEQIYKYAVVS